MARIFGLKRCINICIYRHAHIYHTLNGLLCRCYLAYLDSIKYFRPEVRTVRGEALRTFVYQEILRSYMKWIRDLGYLSMFIWACPPLSGDDYILYCHPENQKTPKNTKLREWYIKMLKKCEEDGVVLGTSNLYDFYWQMGRAPARPVELPYFEGELRRPWWFYVQSYTSKGREGERHFKAG